MQNFCNENAYSVTIIIVYICMDNCAVNRKYKIKCSKLIHKEKLQRPDKYWNNNVHKSVLS